MVTASPCARRNAVNPAGPSTSGNSRLAAALSLVVSVARHRSRTPRSLSTWRALTGEWASRSEARTGTRRSSDRRPCAARCRTAATSRNLKVLHIGKRSSMRWPKRAPLAGCHRHTPRRPPLSASSASKPGVAGLRATALAVRASTGPATIPARAAPARAMNGRRAIMRCSLGGVAAIMESRACRPPARKTIGSHQVYLWRRRKFRPSVRE